MRRSRSTLYGRVRPVLSPNRNSASDCSTPSNRCWRCGTRGAGGAGYRPLADGKPVRIALLRPWPATNDAHYRDGITCDWSTVRLARQPLLAGIKHLNRLEQVLAAAELARSEADDALVCDTAGAVIESVSGNVFLVRDGRLCTPALDQCGVAGVMREVVIEAAASTGIDVEETLLRRSDFAYADEVFLCNAIRGIVPVRRLGAIRLASLDVAARLSRALEMHGLTPCGS